jgi:hypothetical protein
LRALAASQQLGECHYDKILRLTDDVHEYVRYELVLAIEQFPPDDPRVRSAINTLRSDASSIVRNRAVKRLPDST